MVYTKSNKELMFKTEGYKGSENSAWEERDSFKDFNTGGNQVDSY